MAMTSMIQLRMNLLIMNFGEALNWIELYIICTFYIHLDFRVWIAFKKDGQIEVGEDMLDNDSVKETLNVFESVEGFMESLPAIHLPITNHNVEWNISKNSLQYICLMYIIIFINLQIKINI